jgi:hypothetical protein
MYFSLIHEISLMVLFINLHQLVHSDNNDMPSKIASKDFNDHSLRTATVGKSNETHNGSFSSIVRMIAFGVRRFDEDEEQQRKLNIPISNKDPDPSEELQINTRVIFLGLIIRMLLARIAERADTIKKSDDFQKSYLVRVNSFWIKYLTDRFLHRLNMNTIINNIIFIKISEN